MNVRRRLARLLLGRPFFTFDGREPSEAWLVTRDGESVIGMSIKEWEAEFTSSIQPRSFGSNATYTPSQKRTFSGTFR